MTVTHCPAVHNDTRAMHTPYRAPLLLPTDVRARLRPLVRARIYDMADCSQLSYHYQTRSDEVLALITEAEKAL